MVGLPLHHLVAVKDLGSHEAAMREMAEKGSPFAYLNSYLRNKGYEAVHANEAGMSGNTDDQIMNFARWEGRTIITFDKHFSDLLLYPLPEGFIQR